MVKFKQIKKGYTAYEHGKKLYTLNAYSSDGTLYIKNIQPATNSSKLELKLPEIDEQCLPMDYLRGQIKFADGCLSNVTHLIIDCPLNTSVYIGAEERFLENIPNLYLRLPKGAEQYYLYYKHEDKIFDENFGFYSYNIVANSDEVSQLTERKPYSEVFGGEGDFLVLSRNEQSGYRYDKVFGFETDLDSGLPRRDGLICIREQGEDSSAELRLI